MKNNLTKRWIRQQTVQDRMEKIEEAQREQRRYLSTTKDDKEGGRPKDVQSPEKLFEGMGMRDRSLIRIPMVGQTSYWGDKVRVPVGKDNP